MIEGRPVTGGAVIPTQSVDVAGRTNSRTNCGGLAPGLVISVMPTLSRDGARVNATPRCYIAWQASEIAPYSRGQRRSRISPRR